MAELRIRGAVGETIIDGNIPILRSSPGIWFQNSNGLTLIGLKPPIGPNSATYSNSLIASGTPPLSLSGLSSNVYFQALETMQIADRNAASALRLSASTQSAFWHVISDERIVLDREQVDVLIEGSNDRMRENARERANIEAFQRNLRAYFGDPQADGSRIDDVYVTRSSSGDYWKSIRDELQEWFAVGLDPLSALVGLTKVTLLKMVEPDRTLQRGTVKKIQGVHASARAVIQSEGDRGLTWLRTVGAELLKENGLESFESAVDARIFARAERDDYGKVELEPERPPSLRRDGIVPPYSGMKGRF